VVGEVEELEVDLVVGRFEGEGAMVEGVLGAFEKDL
jgi:hypothetical protein